MEETKATKQRRSKFAKWWKTNHHHQKGHTWLCYAARNTVYTYAMNPQTFKDVNYITKRYFKSDYKRLSQNHAWRLWKTVHPLMNRRVRMLEATAEHLSIQKAELKQTKKEIKNEQRLALG
jgi:hypothetical protein